MYGNEFSTIRQYMPGRSAMNLRDQWVDRLQPSLVLTKWTDAEDEALFHAVQKCVVAAGPWR